MNFFISNFVLYSLLVGSGLIKGKLSLGQQWSGLFLFQVLYRFFPYSSQVELNSNLHSFQYVNAKVQATIYSIDLRPCKTESIDNEMGYSGKESE